MQTAGVPHIGSPVYYSDLGEVFSYTFVQIETYKVAFNPKQSCLLLKYFYVSLFLIVSSHNKLLFCTRAITARAWIFSIWIANKYNYILRIF